MAAGPWQEAPDRRRALQLALAALWLLDAVPQYQSFMFSEGFPRMLAATAAGNPGAMTFVQVPGAPQETRQAGCAPGTLAPGWERAGQGR